MEKVFVIWEDEDETLWGYVIAETPSKAKGKVICNFMSLTGLDFLESSKLLKARRCKVLDGNLNFDIILGDTDPSSCELEILRKYKLSKKKRDGYDWLDVFYIFPYNTKRINNKK